MRFARSEFTYLFLSGRDPDVRELLKLQTASGYLDKRYVTPYFQQNHTDICENLQGLLRREPVRTAWIYWAQGMQRAPRPVKRQTLIKSDKWASFIVPALYLSHTYAGRLT